MTDQELIKRLRHGEGWPITAADRIEELVKERDDYVHKLMEANNTYTEMHVEIEHLSDKLTKAVEALRVSLEGLNWAKAYLSTSGIDSVLVNHADAKVYATLAELEGE